jgi:hypothetical protein
MIDFSTCTLSQLSAHEVGNQTNNEQLYASKEGLDVTNSRLQELLLHYFLKPFANPEFYHFTFSNDNLDLNPVYHFISELFEHSGSFHHQSIHIAKHLYECATHHNIRSGDLYVAYFSHIQLEGEYVDAVGIFKSENKDSFLKLKRQSTKFHLDYEDGVNIDKLDKGCLIFNTDAENGFKVCTIDKTNRSADAQYWKDDFLKLKPCSDSFHLTQNFLSVTKAFVTHQMGQEFEVDRADQIDILNKSVAYFKENDEFNEREFTASVFSDKSVIDSFQRFKGDLQRDEDIDMNDSFSISPIAVKQQARVFKSVLKLDKNFHVYIHGNRELIEKGTDSDGRKYYKLYYTNEDM